MRRVGFIGTGNMGSILATAAAKSGEAELLLANRTPEKAEELAKKTGGKAVTNREAARTDVLFLGVKPQQAEGVFGEIAAELKEAKPLLVSMMAGLSIEKLKELSGGLPVIRLMPNTPAFVGEGITLYTASDDVSGDDLEYVLRLLAPTGRISPVEEKLMNAASSVTGAGPAFACMFVDALADGAVRMGIPRKKAIEYAAQMMAGTGKLILETGKHPDELKDEVCSPGGTTIEGVTALEEGAFRASVIRAVTATCEKNSKLV